MKKIFYSWESDLPNNTNRGFIQNALEKAVKKLNQQTAIGLDTAIDRDTLGLPGSPDITESIFKKIDESIAFVCDVSIISNSTSKKPTPNPNVLVELGYAIKSLTWDNIIMVANTYFGNVDELPFDLRGKRILAYRSAVDTTNRSVERNALANSLENALMTILKNEDSLGKYYNSKLEADYIAADRELFRSFLEELPPEIINHLDSSKTVHMDSCEDNGFNSLYHSDVTQPLNLFLIKWDRPGNVFLDSELEQFNKELYSFIKDFIKSNNCNAQRGMAPSIIKIYCNFINKAKMKLAV